MNNDVQKILKILDGMEYRRACVTMLRVVHELSVASESEELRNVVAALLEQFAQEIRP
jgi:hypothetical protein